MTLYPLYQAAIIVIRSRRPGFPYYSRINAIALYKFARVRPPAEIYAIVGSVRSRERFSIFPYLFFLFSSANRA